MGIRFKSGAIPVAVRQTPTPKRGFGKILNSSPLFYNGKAFKNVPSQKTCHLHKNNSRLSGEKRGV
jgi:hypothetical protein